MKKGPKNKSKKDKKSSRAPRSRPPKKSRDQIAREMFEVDDEFRDVSYFVNPGTNLIDPCVGIIDFNNEPPNYARRGDAILPSISQPIIPTLFRALPIHNQSGKLVLRGYFNEDDALCFQSMYPSNDEQLILWFFQYLAFKDLNSDFNWMTSCLVPKYGNV